MGKTSHDQIGHMNNWESFNLADKTASQVSKINTDLVWYAPKTQEYDGNTEGPINTKDTTNSKYIHKKTLFKIDIKWELVQLSI